MPRDIQESINRRRYNQAVTVYSPTRRIARPTGRTANAGTAQNILGGGPTQGPVGTRADFGGAITPRTSQLPGWEAAIGSPGAPPRPLSMMDQILAQPPSASTVAPEPPGGWRGALGTVVNNPIGRGVMTALDTLSYPRRIIQSSVQEVADAFNGGDASFDDWSQQIGDESFGFGNMVPDTGNSLLDGLIGFGGDALMDPATYIGGAGLYSGIAGRTARAGTAAEALALGVKVGELTAEQTSRQIARFGFSRFDDAARAELRAQLPGTAARILDRGYHFKVPLTQRFFHIPGSQPVDWLVSRGAGRVRATLSESPLGGWMRYASNPNGMRDAVTTLVTRRPAGGLTFGQAAEVVNFNNGKKLAQRSFVAKASKMFDDAVKANGGGRSGRAALNDMYRAETTGGTVLHDVYAAIRKMGVDEYGVHIPAFDGPYLPHLRTDLGQKWMEGGSQAANDFKAVLYKTVSDAPAGITKNRSLLAGRTIKIGGESYDIVDGSVDELNRIFHKAVPDVDFDLYDADALSVAHRYVKDLEESVGLVGGLKKVLGSKSGLVRSLHDESLFDRITADDIDALASRDTADVMKAKWREASSTVRKMRTDNQRGISDIGGSFGVEVRAAVAEMETITPTLKKRLDDVVAEEMRKSELRGVGKYGDRFFTPGAASTGSVTRVFEATRKQLEQRFRNLERRLGQLKVDAAAEARRLESRGNVGATPIQDELRRLSAQQGATSQDMATMEAVIQRLETNQAAQGVIDARLGDRDFANLSVADDLSPKSPGVNPTVPVTPTPYTGPSSLAVSRDFNAKRAAILGVEDPQVVEVAARYDAQAQIVDRAQRRAWEARVNNRHAVDTAHQQMLDGREYEAGLKHAVDHIRGRPDQLERHLELSQRLDDFQSGELPRRQAAFRDARRPIDDAERVHKVEAKRLAEIGDEQQAIAQRIDATRGATSQPPLSRSQESTLRSQRTRLARDRGRWLRTPEGQAHVAAQKQLGKVTANLERVGGQIERATQGSGRFFLDDNGVLQTKFTTNEPWARQLIDERDGTLIPARNAAEAHYDAATETWQRLNSEGVDVTSTELTAAQREVSAAWKAWRSAQDAVADTNQRLTQVADTPNLGRIGAEGDELTRLLKVQASMKARADELEHQLTISGETLVGYDTGIAGIDAQLQAQETARRLATEAPVTPVGAQVAALHRAEQQRLDALEAKFAGVRRDWDDAPELPAHPTDLGRFEGQYEDNPVIRRALDAVNRVDGQVRQFDGMDTATDLANSAAALRAAGEPFTVPPVGTPAHAAVTSFSPASRGGAMGAVGRGQAVAAETQRVLDNHIPELVDAGAIPQEFGDDLFRRRLDLDRALDLHAANPSAHLRDDVEAQAADLGRLTNYALRYKQALEGGNEPSDALATFLLARELDDEAASLTRQIDVGRARLANPTIGASELEYTGTLARLNERAATHTHHIEAELAKAKAGAPWDQRSVAQWTRELDIVQGRINRLGPPANSSLDDTIDSHAAYLANDMRDLDDSVATFDENRFVDHRMQYPVRRRDELAAAIPHREAEVLAAKTSQRRLEDAVLRARSNGSTTVRYTPYTTEGYKGGVAEMPLAQAEANLIHNQGVIDMLEHDLVNKQVQSSVLEGTAEHRATLLEREIGDATTPPDPPTLAAENDAIQGAARAEERALSPAELETIASNQARIARLNQGPIPPETLASMQEELGRLHKAIDDFGQVMGGDAARVAVARDGGEGFIASIVQGGRGPLSQADTAMLDDLVGPETAKAAGVWIHHLDEAFAGRTSVPADEVTAVLDDVSATFGDNELVDRLRQRAANIDPDGTVSLNEMRDEFASSLYASANRQRGEAIRETTSMQSLFGTSFVDGPTGLQPRYAAAAADEPSYQLLTARLRTATVEAMRAKGYDPRNAIVDTVANLRTRLGRVETMRRSIEGNNEWLDVLTTGTSSVEARRQTLEAGKEALQVEERQLLGELDAPRQARLAEQRKLLDERVANETEPIAAALTSVQRQADHVERTYTARLAELDMQLADVRGKVTEAFRDHDAHRTATDQYRRALEANPARNTESQRQAIEDLRALNEYSRGLTGVEAREADTIEAQLVAASQATAAMDAQQVTSDGFRARYAAAAKNPARVAKLTKDLLTDEWRLMARGLIEDTPEGLLVSKQLAAAIENVVPVVATPKFWQFVDRYTAFFKTYATSRPGFHVRNAISATFMNLVDGVRIRDMYEGARLWRQYERNPNFWMEAGTDPRVRDAFHAVFASGAGGAYIEPGLYTAAAGGNAMYRFLMDNALTRFNRRLGSRVEGSARLAMALNSMRGRGATAEQAARRISKFHFDYTEMSDLDHMARRVIPFWTFMSRNLPLQMEQMFTNPRMYLAYENLKRNLQEPLDPYTPDYWITQGAFTVDTHAADRESPWYIAPDLPHLRVTEPLDALARGEPGAAISNINPLFLAPAEAFLMGKKMYTGAQLGGGGEPAQYEATSPLNPFTQLFNLLGATETGGSGDTVVDKRYAHVARSLFPPWEFAERLLDPTGKRAGRTDETVLRALGAPVYQLTPELRESTRNRAYYEREDQYQTQADLARM